MSKWANEHASFPKRIVVVASVASFGRRCVTGILTAQPGGSNSSLPAIDHRRRSQL